MPRSRIVLLCLLATPTAALAGAQAPLDTGGVSLRWTADPLRLDGLPDESAWASADSIAEFTQQEPAEGRPSTERTLIRVLGTRDGLWVAVWAFDSRPEAIHHAQLRRDADFDSDDRILLLLDPQHDRRTGYLFQINANGALNDAEVLNSENTNGDWDGVWDARARITDRGWTAEMLIPWQTLRYPPRVTEWGFNVARVLRRKNEVALWRAWHRQEGILFEQAAGTLTGMGRLPPRGRIELRPYFAPTRTLAERAFGRDGSDSITAGARSKLKFGGDAKVALSSSLTLDLTANTDFAQVEADSQVINLSRFPVFFPEKRQFFLESSGIFDFGQAERNLLFYSRRIGLDTAGVIVPIDAGLRLSGRAGRERIGLLAVQTGGSEDALDIVARGKHDVFDRSFVGAMATMQSLPGGRGTRLAYGVDQEFRFLPGRQNLTIASWVSATQNGAGATTRTSFRVLVDYPNDWSDDFLSLNRIEDGYDPALGFVLESGIWRGAGAFSFFPRPGILGIRRLNLEPLEFDVTDHLDGSLSHYFLQMRPLGAEFESGDQFELNLQRSADVPSEAFEVFPGSTIPAGRLAWNRVQLVFTSSTARTVGISLSGSAGGFYDGHSSEADATVDVRLAPHLTSSLEYALQAVTRAMGDFTARTVRLRLDLAASPRLGGTMFIQQDTASDRLTINLRLHWVPRPGSDAYLVYNSGWPTGLSGGIPWSRPAAGGLVAKFVYYVRK